MGYKNDEEVKRKTIAPYQEFKYVYNYDRESLNNEDTYDVLPIRISLRDKYDSLMNYANRSFTIETTGPIKIIGPKVQSLLGGQITVYVRSLNDKGRAKVKFIFDDEIKEIELNVNQN